MLPRIAITRTWSDADVAQLNIEVCDGTSVFTNQAYVPLDWGTRSAAALRTFGRQVHGGIFDLKAGNDGPEYASGSFRARLHYYNPNQLLITVNQQGEYFPFKGSEVAPTAATFLRTEPSLLDRFVDALAILDTSDGEQAVLECTSVSQ